MALAFAVAASANLPALVYNLFWRRFNTRGAVWSIYGGLISCLALVIFSPVVSGKGEIDRRQPVAAADQHRHLLVPAGEPRHHLDPARLPPAASSARITSKEPAAEERYTELEVRALTGAGSEKAIKH